MAKLDESYLLDCRERTLKMINVFREHRGMQPLVSIPKGKQGSGEACPIAMGLGVPCIVSDTVYFEDLEDAKAAHANWIGDDFTQDFNDLEIDLPDVMDQFVANFDEGRYPDLIEGESK